MPTQTLTVTTSEQVWDVVVGVRPGLFEDANDATYVATSTDEDNEVLRFDAFSAVAVGVNSAWVDARMRKESSNADVCALHWNVDVGIGEGASQSVNDVGWVDYDLVITSHSPPLEISDFEDPVNHWFGIRLKTVPAADRIRCSEMSVTVDYIPPGGGFAFLLYQWLPPLLAVASHGLTKFDVATVLASSNPRPSNNEDYARIVEAFKVRPAYGFLA